MNRLLALLLLTYASAAAWDQTGHRLVACIAYSRLTENARRNVDGILKTHVAYSRWAEGVADPSERARAAFLAASHWPDDVRSDPRYHQGPWHYFNLNFSPDGTPFPEPDVSSPSALTKIREFRRTIGDTRIPASERAIDLSWLIHVVGDIHQPLHAASRYTRSQIDSQTGKPYGDRGGNEVYVRGAANLHMYWDDLFKRSRLPIERLAAALMRFAPPPGQPQLDEWKWVQESFVLAKNEVYTFGDGPGSKAFRITLPPGYRTRALQIARTRAALAGYRLAAVINERFP